MGCCSYWLPVPPRCGLGLLPQGARRVGGTGCLRKRRRTRALLMLLQWLSLYRWWLIVLNWLRLLLPLRLLLGLLLPLRLLLGLLLPLRLLLGLALLLLLHVGMERLGKSGGLRLLPWVGHLPGLQLGLNHLVVPRSGGHGARLGRLSLQGPRCRIQAEQGRTKPLKHPGGRLVLHGNDGLDLPRSDDKALAPHHLLQQ